MKRFRKIGSRVTRRWTTKYELSHKVKLASADLIDTMVFSFSVAN